MSVDPRLSAGHCAKRAACLTSSSCEPWELRVGLPAYSAETGSPRSHRQESAPAVRTQASPTPAGCVCPFLYLAQKRRYSPGVQRVFPYISAMVNNGSLSYDHERDGRPTELGGCTAIVRNLHYDTFLVIRYVKRHLTIMMDIDGKHEWRDCIEVPGVRLPRGYYFGTSSITGDLSDNHDVISLKLFELTVERTPEEEKLHRDVFLPSVDNMKLPEMTAPLPPLSGLALFLIVFFSLVFSVFAIVIGIILYNKWQDQSRKRFY
ncbi:VIP36-like protein isoform X5 [Ovis canadensis]|uniref:VIP36-like protein isoform X5 n=1 Tax=Ovis canadensis TaxID=37174 RepID=UPI003753770F